MITRLLAASQRGRLASALSFGTAILSVVTVACQKVPLLAPTGSNITLTASANALPLGGTADLIAQVVQAGGTAPQSGTHVIFTTTLGTIQPSDAQTDTTGRVTVKFLAGTTSGTATITATSGGATVGDKGAVKIAIGASAVGKVGVAANPTTVPFAGGDSVITASVLDLNGNALPNVPVTFTTTAGGVSSAVVTTDSNGNAQTKLTTNKAATVTATAGVSGGTGGGTGSSNNTGTIQVGVNALSTVAVGNPSPTSPIVGQPVTFALTYTQPTGSSPIQRVIVDWGDGSPAQTYSGAPSAVSHTYFTASPYVVRATAVDTFGDAATGSNSVTVANKPVLAVTVTPPTTQATVGTPTTFTIAATPTTGNAITEIFVEWGDTSSDRRRGNATTLQHVYSSSNTYTVTVTATDNSGATGTGFTTIFVK